MQFQRHQAAFTLIEILVVLLIVSIMSGVAVANLPAFTRTADFDMEGRRLKTLLGLAREEALFQASEFGFKPDDKGYQFMVYDELNQSWETYEVSPFKPRKLNEGIVLDLKIEGDSSFDLGDKAEGALPPLMLLSSGEITPFSLRITQGELIKTLTSDGYGDIKWATDE